jgi:hypothetical protein
MKLQANYIFLLLIEQILGFEISQQNIVEKKSDFREIIVVYFEMRAC